MGQVGQVKGATETIVFFDGYCGLCNGVVDFLIDRDHGRKLVYSPLQGETARLVLSDRQRNDLDTVVVVHRDPNGATLAQFEKSEAVLKALERLDAPWSALAKAARIFPRAFRDMVYDLVAKNRFRIFGRRDSCRAPTLEERKSFLP